MQSLLTAINNRAALTGADGVVAEDLRIGAVGPNPAGQFNLRARAVGWKEAQIQSILTGTFTIYPNVTERLDDNLNDLRPRNHLYVTSGLTNLSVTFPFNSTTNADGYHELTALAYEGSHVRTQTRVTQPVLIQNYGWSAALTSLFGGTNVAVEANLQFSVTTTTNSISKIELFSTGGSLGVANNVGSATFTNSAAFLGIGMHPFYAVVTRINGQQYRTATIWRRVVGTEPPFAVTVQDAAPTLVWPATAGRNYQVLSSTNLTNIVTIRASVTPTNNMGQWSESNGPAPQQYYRVKAP